MSAIITCENGCGRTTEDPDLWDPEITTGRVYCDPCWAKLHSGPSSFMESVRASHDAKVTMPSRYDLEKALHVLDLAICAAEDDDLVPAGQLGEMHDAYVTLGWFVR